MIQNIIGLYFSPSGGTRKITEKIVKEMSDRLSDMSLGEISSSYVDLLETPPKDDVVFDEDTVIVIGMPVFTGRIPEICSDYLKHIHGRGTLAVTVVSFGNRSYGDSLCELYTIVSSQGFSVVSAGAFISQHSMFKKVAEDRPDAYDLQKLKEFCRLSANKVRRFSGTEIAEMRGRPAPLDVSGSMPEKKPMHIPLHPTGNSHCVGCGACVRICPVDAIDPSDPRKTDAKKCISCTACITVCPNGARGFHGPMSAASRIALEKLASRRKDPEWFI
jgi:ferredoxin